MFKKKEVEKLNIATDVAQTAVSAALAQSIKRKTVLLVASVCLLIAVLIAGSIAWYTKTTGAQGVSLHAATTELRANFVDDHIVVDINQYKQVKGERAAPGTTGAVPLLLESTGETGLDYSIQLDFSETAPEFMERIRYYYVDPTTGQEKTINPKSSMDDGAGIHGTFSGPEVNALEYIRWEWVWTLDSDNFYVPGENGGKGIWYTKDTILTASIDDVQKQVNGQQYFDYLYPSEDGYWIKNASGEYRHYGAGQKATVQLYDKITHEPATITSLSFKELKEKDLFDLNADQKFLEEAREEWDAFDTEIGLGHFDYSFTSTNTNLDPFEAAADADGSKDKMYAYQKAMEAKLVITGAQALPQRIENYDYQNPVQFGTITDIPDGFHGFVILDGQKYWVQKETGSQLIITDSNLQL